MAGSSTPQRPVRQARSEPWSSRFCAGHLIAGHSALFDLAGAWMIGLIAWSTLRIFESDFSSGEFIGVTGIATLPTWPFRLLILLGVTVAAIQCVVRAIQSLSMRSPKVSAE